MAEDYDVDFLGGIPLDIKIRGNQLIERFYATRMPHTFLSVITDDCIATGLDYNAGGARYNNTFIQAVGIGTTVTVTDLAANKPATYHILGPWDSDPALGIISYPAALAQALFNKKPGDIIEAAGETGKLKLRIDRIEKTPDSILQAL